MDDFIFFTFSDKESFLRKKSFFVIIEKYSYGIKIAELLTGTHQYILSNNEYNSRNINEITDRYSIKDIVTLQIEKYITHENNRTISGNWVKIS